MDFKKTQTDMLRTWPEIATPHAAVAALGQRVGALLNRQAKAALRPHGLSFTEFELLVALRVGGGGPMLPSELYEALLISSGGLTKVLNGLERRGLVCRTRSSGDARQRPFMLSEAGSNLVERAMESVLAEHETTIRAALGGDEQVRYLLAALQRLAEELA